MKRILKIPEISSFYLTVWVRLWKLPAIIHLLELLSSWKTCGSTSQKKARLKSMGKRLLAMHCKPLTFEMMKFVLFTLHRSNNFKCNSKLLKACVNFCDFKRKSLKLLRHVRFNFSFCTAE